MTAATGKGRDPVADEDRAASQGPASDSSAAGAPVGEADKPKKSFYGLLASAPAYPFRELGWAAIVAGAGIFWVLNLLASFWAFGVFAVFAIATKVLLVGYLAVFVIKVLASSAGGDDAPPDWPDFADAWDDVLKPLLRLLGAAMIAFLPLIIAFVLDIADMAAGLEQPGPDPVSGGIGFGRMSRVFWPSLVVGVIYLPMGLIAVALYDTMEGFNPILVLRGIAKTFPAYLVAMAMFLACCFVSLFAVPYLSENVPIVGSLVAWAANLYLLMVEMRILGLLYRTHALKLGWFEWAPRPPAWADKQDG